MHRSQLVPLSRWAIKKRAYVAKLKAQKAAEEKLVTDLIGVAAKYIQTSDLHDFSNEVRTLLEEHHKRSLSNEC